MSLLLLKGFSHKFDKIHEGRPVKKLLLLRSIWSSLGDRPLSVKNLLESCDLMVIDEAHGSDANTYSNVLLDYKNLNNDYKILGLTATPYRSSDSNFHSFEIPCLRIISLLQMNQMRRNQVLYNI